MSLCDDIIIDDEFASFNDPLADDEYRQLLANIERDGKFTDPLIVWDADNGDWILIDGHNRINIWRTVYDCSPKWEPKVVSLKFDDRDSVLLWIDAHQRGRRNEPAAARALKALKLKPVLERKAKANQQLSEGRGKGSQNSENLIEPVHVDKELAKRADVSTDTIRKVEKVAAQAVPELTQAMKSGKVAVDVAAKAAELPVEQQQQVVEAIKSAEKPKKAAADAVKAASVVSKPSSIPARKWDILDDIGRFRDLIRKLEGNWTEKADRDAMRQFFLQCSKEV